MKHPSYPLHWLQVPGLKLDISEQVQLRIVLALCYQFTRNSEKAQELMRETFEHSPVHLEEYSGDTVMALGLFYRYAFCWESNTFSNNFC